MLRLHTLGSAQVLGVADRVGSLEPGKFADFVVLDPRSPDIGPLWHPLANYVLSGSPRSLAAVYVGGRLVSERGASTHPLAAEAVAKVPRTTAAGRGPIRVSRLRVGGRQRDPA